MAGGRYPKVPAAKIGSLDITSFAGGQDQRGAANQAPNSFTGRNIMVNSQGLGTFRLVKKRWLPDAVGTVYEVFPAFYNNTVYNIIADDGKIKYIYGTETDWIDAGGDNDVTTTIDNPVTFIRSMNKVVIMNGIDEIGYLDLATMDVVHFDFIASPTTVPTSALVGGLTATPHKVYYAIWYSGVVGKTASTPIVTVGVSKIREQWDAAGTQGVTITDPNTRPAGVKNWNVGLATAPAGGTIQLSDILPIALGLDIASTTFTDNGKLPQLTNAGTAPTTNSTRGPKAKYGKELDGRLFLYGIKDDEYAVMIGGDEENAFDFTEANGGYRLVLNEGTNYYPQNVVGFRNGPGAPSITVLYSNTQGLSKQSIIEQSTVSLGTFSAKVWGSTDQNYGAAGVASPYAAVNYKGKLVVPTVDGFIEYDTEASLQNVLLPKRITDPLVEDIGSIQTDLLPKIVGTAWENRMLFIAPTRGFNYNNKILAYDVTRRGNECWYTMDIEAQWIGTHSPPGSAGFVYIVDGNHFYKLEKGYIAADETPEGLLEPFPTELTTALIGTNASHNGYYAVVQAVFYLQDFLGSAELTVRWRDKNSGKMKSRSRTVRNGEYASSSDGNWSSPGYQFNQAIPTSIEGWSGIDVLSDGQGALKVSKPYPVRLNNVITNELQGTIATGLDNSSIGHRSISFEGQPLGISPDVG